MKEKEQKIKIKEEREVVLPDPPKIEKGQMAMRMVYKNGKSCDVVGESMFECVSLAMAAARKDGFEFASQDIVSWERIA